MAYHYKSENALLAVGANTFTHAFGITPQGVTGAVRLTFRGGTGTGYTVTGKDNTCVYVLCPTGFNSVDVECERYHSVIR